MITTNCLYCNFEIKIKPSQFENGRGKFCSKKCQHLFRTIELFCCICNQKFIKLKSRLSTSKSGLYFCSRKCKDAAQKIGGIKEIMPPHYGTSEGRDLYRNLIKNTINPKCNGCGESRKFLLQVHHIDGDSNNNILSNFEIVCANCHIIRHLKFQNGCWIYSTHTLTDRNIINNF